MRQIKESIPFETNATEVTVTGWACKTCGLFWGNGDSGERAAKYCCCTDRKCEGCDSRCSKHYMKCDDCRQLDTRAKFERLAAKPYDGSAVCTYDSDRYFFDEESLRDWLYEMEADDRESVMLVFTECRPPRWDRSIGEELCDELAEDQEFDTREIDKQVAEWVKAHAPDVYHPTNVAVDSASLRELIATLTD